MAEPVLILSRADQASYTRWPSFPSQELCQAPVGHEHSLHLTTATFERKAAT